MKKLLFKSVLIIGLTAAAVIWNGEIRSRDRGSAIGIANAVVGRPATPVSYAGVARRTTVRLATPGVGVRPFNRGGPVNRVGRR